MHTGAAMEVSFWNILCKWQVLLEGAKVNDWASWREQSSSHSLLEGEPGLTVASLEAHRRASLASELQAFQGRC